MQLVVAGRRGLSPCRHRAVVVLAAAAINAAAAATVHSGTICANYPKSMQEKIVVQIRTG